MKTPGKIWALINHHKGLERWNTELNILLPIAILPYFCKIDNKTEIVISSEKKSFRQEEMDLSRRRRRCRRRTIDFRIYLTSVERAPPQSSSVHWDMLNYLPPSVTEIVVTLYNNTCKWCTHLRLFFFYANRPLLMLTWHMAPILLSHTENLVLLFLQPCHVIRVRAYVWVRDAIFRMRFYPLPFTLREIITCSAPCVIVAIMLSWSYPFNVFTTPSSDICNVKTHELKNVLREFASLMWLEFPLLKMSRYQ